MDTKLALRITELYERFSRTEEYQRLLEEYHYQNDRFLDTVATLTQEQQNVISDYLDVYYRFYDKLAEFMCE